VLSIAISVVALVVAVLALKQDKTTAADTRELAAEANGMQARLLAIEQARRLEERAPSFQLTYDGDYRDPKQPDYSRLLVTYNGPTPCEIVRHEEVRDARWSTVAELIEPHEGYSDGSRRGGILRHFEPGETRPLAVKVNPDGQPGEIRLRFMATINGHEYPPIVESCEVAPPPGRPGVRFM
jgi:hypothetical protein